ncbi:hypothetical protein GCM10028821_12430 [Hymenobacter jeollabukensis]
MVARQVEHQLVAGGSVYQPVAAKAGGGSRWQRAVFGGGYGMAKGQQQADEANQPAAGLTKPPAAGRYGYDRYRGIH